MAKKKYYSGLEAMKLVEEGHKVRNLDWEKSKSFIMKITPIYRVKLDINIRNNFFIAMFHKNGTEYFPEPYIPTTLDLFGGSNWTTVELKK